MDYLTALPVREGDRELAALLLSKGADVGAANPQGTALHVATQQGHPAVVGTQLMYVIAAVPVYAYFEVSVNTHDQFPILHCSRTRLQIASSPLWSPRFLVALCNA
jgi:hypothetical protein